MVTDIEVGVGVVVIDLVVSGVGNLFFVDRMLTSEEMSIVEGVSITCVGNISMVATVSVVAMTTYAVCFARF